MRERIPDGYDAANLEAMSEARAYQAAMRRLVMEKLTLHARRGVVLDFGAGRGDYAAAIQRQTAMTVVGMEPDVRLHEHYPATVQVVASLERIAPGSLDCAYSLNVLEHIEKDVRALRELATRCRPGAPIFLLVPANPSLWTPMDTLVGHWRRYMPATLRATAEQAGLVVDQCGWFDRTGYFATRAYQMLHDTGLLTAQRPGAVSRRQIRWFDALFQLAEPVFGGLNLPFGKNCWVLARRPHTHHATLAPIRPRMRMPEWAEPVPA
jgi:SAM-dependent methyltransferase